MARVERQCEQCGKTISGKSSDVARGKLRFCSNSCRGESRRTRVERQCEQCGGAFSPQPSRVAQGEGRFCSRACLGSSMRVVAERQCETCGGAFFPSASNAARGGGRFCSRACYGLARRVVTERQCETCGETFFPRASDVSKGGGRFCSRDCYVVSNRTHGLSGTREYRSWSSARHRCTNPNDPNWANYGGRGIQMCERWLDSFENFLADMGERPQGMSLERDDVDGDYEPGNCRWATLLEQNRNKRSVRDLQARLDLAERRAERAERLAARFALSLLLQEQAA